MNNLESNNQKVADCLAEIREACTAATSMDDTNMNLIIEDIGRLARVAMESLKD